MGKDFFSQAKTRDWRIDFIRIFLSMHGICMYYFSCLLIFKYFRVSFLEKENSNKYGSIFFTWNINVQMSNSIVSTKFSVLRVPCHSSIFVPKSIKWIYIFIKFEWNRSIDRRRRSVTTIAHDRGTSRGQTYFECTKSTMYRFARRFSIYVHIDTCNLLWSTYPNRGNEL